MNNLFTLSFWFNQRPDHLLPFFRNSLVALIVSFLILAILSFIFKKKPGLYAKLWEKIFNLSSTNIVIGAVFLLFNDQRIPMLSARYWYILWAIGLATWIFFIVRYAKTLPEKKKEFEKQREFEKYLPK